ncbi:hypothetical protein J4218_01065 [Candidatus Pacearchaeota archaeon]|nr:hypothetical protein [Candidatus Pacearchaeota archaeon]
MLKGFQFAYRYSNCNPGMFSTERSVEIKHYNLHGELDLDYITIHEDQVDENLGLVGITRIREIMGDTAIIDINDSQTNSTFKVPLESIVNLG